MRLWTSVATTVAPSDLYIVDQIRDSDGQLVTGALALLYKDGNVLGQCVTDAQGIYKFDNVPAGNYRVEIYLDDVGNVTVANIGAITSSYTGNVVISNTVAPTLSPNIAENTTTGIDVTDSGSAHSSFLPPYVTTDDGYIGQCTVDPVTGEILGVNTIFAGNGTATTTSVVPVTDKIPPAGNVTISGSSTFTQLADAFVAYYSRQGQAFNYALQFRFGSQFAWYTPYSGFPTGRLASKISQVYHSPIVPHNAGVPFFDHMLGLAHFASGYTTVRDTNFGALSAYDFYEVAEWGTEQDPFIKIKGWVTEVVSRPVSYDSEAGFYYDLTGYEAPGYYASISAKFAAEALDGVYDSYGSYIARKNTVAQVRPKSSTPKTDTTVSSETLSSRIEKAIEKLLFEARGFADIIMDYASTYMNTVSTTYNATPSVNDGPLPIVQTNLSDELDNLSQQSNPYRDMIYGDNKAGGVMWSVQDREALVELGETPDPIGRFLYPYLNPQTDVLGDPRGTPTSTNTGIPNPEYIPNYISADEFNQVKGYLGPKYMPQVVLPAGVIDTLSQMDAKYSTNYTSSVSQIGSVIFDTFWQFGEAVVDIAKGRPAQVLKEGQDLGQQLYGLSKGNAPEWLWGKSFVTADSRYNSPYAYRHSWNASNGQYTITKIKFK